MLVTDIPKFIPEYDQYITLNREIRKGSEHYSIRIRQAETRKLSKNELTLLNPKRKPKNQQEADKIKSLRDNINPATGLLHFTIQLSTEISKEDGGQISQEIKQKFNLDNLPNQSTFKLSDLPHFKEQDWYKTAMKEPFHLLSHRMPTHPSQAKTPRKKRKTNGFTTNFSPDK